MTSTSSTTPLSSSAGVASTPPSPSTHLSDAAPVVAVELTPDVADSKEDIELFEELFGFTDGPGDVVPEVELAARDAAKPPNTTSPGHGGEAETAASLKPQNFQPPMTPRPTPTSPTECPDASASPQKRKRQASDSVDASSDKENDAGVPVAKKKLKVKPTNNDIVKEPPSKPISLNGPVDYKPNKYVAAMRSQKGVPVPPPMLSKDALAAAARQGVRRASRIAPSMLFNFGKDRDANGGMSAHDRRNRNAPIEEHMISNATPSSAPTPNPDNANATLLEVPVSKKWINMYGKTIATEKILATPHNYPQFTLVETIEGAHKKTGEMVTKAHKFRCENSDDAQIAALIKAGLARESAAAKQEKKDAAAALKRTRGGRVGKKGRA